MINKLLIANRGEIALRILRAAKELKIPTVAAYSEADKDLMHVKMADESICIGPADSSQSYLNIPAIISAMELSGADGVHPGYGFLSENPDFAEKVEKSGFDFVGPSGSVIRMMGNKVSAKEFALKSGLPIVPGSSGPIDENVHEEAEKIGYPVIIKAASGGGGRGMKIVYNPEELDNAIELTQQESAAAFGDSTVYLEKFLESPRHIEVQVIADRHGNVLHLGDRDCSLQRRHQKVIEEAPAMGIKEEKRQEIYAQCIEACRQLNYVSAGTFEFLYENDNFYFIEMNTRIQVEHPITEQVIDYDLIKEQIKVAAGVKVSGNHYYPKLHSIECRINAEDPENDFRPSPGKITNLHLPGGQGVRVDTHVYSGYTISPNYDSMIAKIITTSQSGGSYHQKRKEAINKMRRALDEFVIEGIKTTITFHRKLMDNEDYINGVYTTKFMEDFED